MSIRFITIVALTLMLINDRETSLLCDSDNCKQIVQANGDILFLIDGARLYYSFEKNSRDSLSLDEYQKIDLSTIQKENQFEKEWLDSANRAFKEKYDLVHPYNLVRNRNELYQRVFVVVRYADTTYVKYQVHWEVGID